MCLTVTFESLFLAVLLKALSVTYESLSNCKRSVVCNVLQTDQRKFFCTARDKGDDFFYIFGGRLIF